MATFGERLRELREELDLTQEMLAKEIGSQKETISRWENGRRTPSNDAIFDLADYFETPISYLLGQSNERHFHHLSDEEAAAAADAEEQEIIDYYICKFKDLSPEMQHLVKITVANAYKTDKEFGRLRSQQEE